MDPKPFTMPTLRLIQVLGCLSYGIWKLLALTLGVPSKPDNKMGPLICFRGPAILLRVHARRAPELQTTASGLSASRGLPDGLCCGAESHEDRAGFDQRAGALPCSWRSSCRLLKGTSLAALPKPASSGQCTSGVQAVSMRQCTLLHYFLMPFIIWLYSADQWILRSSESATTSGHLALFAVYVHVCFCQAFEACCWGFVDASGGI